MLCFLGASGHAKVVIEIAELSDEKINCLYDQNTAIIEVLGYEVKHDVPHKPSSPDEFFLVTIGNNEIRKKIVEASSFRYKTLIHPKSNISSRSQVGEGTVIMAGVSVNSSTRIGRHAILNTNCSIDHDCSIGDYAHVSPNAALAGNVTVGEGTHIGIGASVIQGINIGKWCTIGAGAIVIKDLPDYATAVGNPARIIKIKE